MLEAQMFSLSTLGFLGQRPQCVPEVGAVNAAPFLTQDPVTNPGIDLFLLMLGRKSLRHIPFEVSSRSPVRC